MKTLLGIWNAHAKGKSSTCIELRKIIIKKNPVVLLDDPKRKDFTLVVRLNRKVIAILSKGDPGSGLKERLHDVISDFKPHVIITTCRTRGKTSRAILGLQPAYDVIWSSTYESEISALQPTLNRIKARQLFNLLLKLKRL